MNPAPLHILFYSQSLFYGGAEEYVHTIARALGDGKFRFTFMHDEHSQLGHFIDRLAETGVRVERIPKIRGKSDVGNFIRQVREFRRLAPDVVHFNQSDPYSQQYSVIAARSAGIRNLVSTYHLTPRSRTGTMRGRLFEKLLARLLCRVLVLSEGNRREITANFPFPEHKVTVVENSVEDPGTLSAAERENLKSLLGIQGSPHILACAGRLTAQKGFSHLLEALRMLGRSDVVAILAGDGPLGPDLRSMARERGLAQSVLFTGFRSDVSRILSLSDFVVIPSLYEGQPFVLLEAMAAGKAVVASRVYGIAETVADGETGLLVEPASPGELANAIGRLLEDPARCRAMGAKARESFEKHFTAQRFGEVMKRFYLDFSRNGRST